MPADRAALGAFLRSRRDRLTPAQAGITAFPGPRRVPGLRKEELAVLAGLSPDHYSRIEQGRQPTLSDDVLDSLARALRLDDAERAHLRDLAAPAVQPIELGDATATRSRPAATAHHPRPRPGAATRQARDGACPQRAAHRRARHGPAAGQFLHRLAVPRPGR